SFFLLAAVLMVGSITMSIVSVHLLTLLQAQGVSLAVAVSLGALIGPAQVGARVIEMLCGARLHPVWTLAAAVGFVALGLVLLAAGFPIVALSLLLYGGGNGLYSIARGTLPLALFGPQRYAPLIGRLALPNLIAQALAPSLGAVVLVQAGANGTLLFLAVLAVANFALLASLFHATGKLRRAPAL
ncbi:MAG: major facilitator superfamily 1, partial [Rhodospirillales bacterium]|nr:major facilitator superfamily 1 [Rhodospirillales bacterium]